MAIIIILLFLILIGIFWISEKGRNVLSAIWGAIVWFLKWIVLGGAILAGIGYGLYYFADSIENGFIIVPFLLVMLIIGFFFTSEKKESTEIDEEEE